MILFCTLFNIQVVCIVVCNLNIGCLIVHWHIVHIVNGASFNLSKFVHEIATARVWFAADVR